VLVRITHAQQRGSVSSSPYSLKLGVSQVHGPTRYETVMISADAILGGAAGLSGLKTAVGTKILMSTWVRNVREARSILGNRIQQQPVVPHPNAPVRRIRRCSTTTSATGILLPTRTPDLLPEPLPTSLPRLTPADGMALRLLPRCLPGQQVFQLGSSLTEREPGVWRRLLVLVVSLGRLHDISPGRRWGLDELTLTAVHKIDDDRYGMKAGRRTSSTRKPRPARSRSITVIRALATRTSCL